MIYCSRENQIIIGTSHAHTTFITHRTQRGIRVVPKRARTRFMVHLYPAGNYTALYIIQNFKSPADIDNPVWLFLCQEKTILYIHGVNKNSLEGSMVKGVAYDP